MFQRNKSFFSFTRKDTVLFATFVSAASSSIQLSATGSLLDITHMCYEYRIPLLPGQFRKPRQSDLSVTSTLHSVNRWRHNEYLCCSHPSRSYISKAHLLSRSDSQTWFGKMCPPRTTKARILNPVSGGQWHLIHLTILKKFCYWTCAPCFFLESVINSLFDIHLAFITLDLVVSRSMTDHNWDLFFISERREPMSVKCWLTVSDDGPLVECLNCVCRVEASAKPRYIRISQSSTTTPFLLSLLEMHP